MIGGFYIDECYCILHALGNEIENLAVFNLVDFCNSPNRQSKVYAKFSSYAVFKPIIGTSLPAIDVIMNRCSIYITQ